jgi:hypothetical protein
MLERFPPKRMRRDGTLFAFHRYRGSGPDPLPRGRRLGVHGLHRRDILRLDWCGPLLCGASLKDCVLVVVQNSVSRERKSHPLRAEIDGQGPESDSGKGRLPNGKREREGEGESG